MEENSDITVRNSSQTSIGYNTVTTHSKDVFTHASGETMGLTSHQTQSGPGRGHTYLEV